MKTHKDLDVWKKSINLVTEIYKVTKDYPQSELYGLTNQIRRCSVSISSNIAEGAARTSSKEFSHFLSITLGSIAELETQILISQNLGYIRTHSFEEINKIITMSEEILNIKIDISTPYQELTINNYFEALEESFI